MPVGTEAQGGGGEQWDTGPGLWLLQRPHRSQPALVLFLAIPTEPPNGYKESLSAGWIYQVQRQRYPKSSSQAMGTMKSIKSRGLEGPPSGPSSTARLPVPAAPWGRWPSTSPGAPAPVALAFTEIKGEWPEL